jgi:hypothetical protein
MQKPVCGLTAFTHATVLLTRHGSMDQGAPLRARPDAGLAAGRLGRGAFRFLSSRHPSRPSGRVQRVC